MNQKLQLQFVLLALLVPFFGVTFAQINSSWPTLSLPAPKTNLFSLDPTLTNRIFTTSNSVPTISRSSSASAPLSPGIYSTKPFAGIVVVPKAHCDDGCIVGGTNVISKIETSQPDLQFLPLTPKAK